MAQWWEHSPPPHVARVRILASTPYVGWVCCWFSPLLREISLRLFRFYPLLKNQTLPISFNSIWNARTRFNELLRTPNCSVGKEIINLGKKLQGYLCILCACVTKPHLRTSIENKSNFCHILSLCCRWEVLEYSPCSLLMELVSFLQGGKRAFCHSAHTICSSDKSCCYGNRYVLCTERCSVQSALQARPWWCGL